MIKRRTLVRLTRLWLALYIMTWCMTFTMSDVAMASSFPDDMDMKIYALQSASYANTGETITSGFLLHNNGSVSINNVTIALGSSTDEGGGALQVIGTPQVVNNTRFIDNNNTSTGGAVYIEGENVTINVNTFNNNNGSYQAIDQDFEEVLGNVTGRDTDFRWGVSQENVTKFIDDYIFIEVIGHEFEDNRTVDLWKIEHINPGETAVIMFTQNVTQNDVYYREKIDNTVYVIGPGTGDASLDVINVTQTIWTSDPVTITFDDSRNVTSTTIHKGSPIGSLPVPEKEGCIFDGWYTESGVKVSPKTVINASMKLYARWVEKEKPADVSVPQTGDQWNVWLYAGIGIVAVIGLVVLILRRRK